MKFTKDALLILALSRFASSASVSNDEGANEACNLGAVLPTGDDSNNDPLLYHPRFHLMPPTRLPKSDGSYAPEGMNDMNPVFQAPNGNYHVMYQDHLNCPDDMNQGNQSFGHIVSEDLTKWEHLPPALVDVESFDDALGPWDGIAFNCRNIPTIIYNSHFEGTDFGAQTKTGARPSSGEQWETEVSVNERSEWATTAAAGNDE